MLKAIIFDMDGVLVDTVDTNFESFNMVLSKYGVTIKNDNSYNGMSLRDQLNLWKKEYPNIPKSIDADDFSRESFVEQFKLIKDDLKPDNNILFLIESAKKQNIKIAVATSSTKKRAITLLKHVDIFNKLDVFVSAEDVTRHKPNPDIFLKAATLLKVEPIECLVIEDAISGIEAANLAGMKSIAKIIGSHTIDDFQNADDVFYDFSEISIDNLKKIFTK